jgi:hypothetical protein
MQTKEDCVNAKNDTTGDLFDEPTVATKWDREETRRALDELFTYARQYNSSKDCAGLLHFVARFRFYSPYNAMLIYTQMKGARYVAPAHRWMRDYGRQIKVGARPIVILQPMGPVMFVFDVVDTVPGPGAPALPPEVEKPFEVRGGRVGKEVKLTMQNAKRDGVNIIERPQGSQSGGSIQSAAAGRFVDVLVRLRPVATYEKAPLRYELLLNANYSAESRYATLAHELGHLYCGHLGSPNDKWWPNRRELSLAAREFEAESVCFLVCSRLGIENPSAQYLAGYVQKHEETPPISLDCIMKAAGLIEQMGRERMKPRTPESA